jgi:hypothetical protein
MSVDGDTKKNMPETQETDFQFDKMAALAQLKQGVSYCPLQQRLKRKK